MRLLASVVAVVAALMILSVAPARADDWQDELSPATPGSFSPPRPMVATYRCGWSGLSAATLDVTFSRPKNDVLQLEARGVTTGLVRALWRLDATHSARAHASMLMPIDVRQLEIYRNQTIHTELDFDEQGVSRLREVKPADKPARRKRFEYPNLYDLHSALLYVRSRKLDPNETINLVVYPATTPYLATVRVIGREKIKIRAGSYPAIKLDLKLQKITDDFKLEPHGKFRHATGWISDDNDRLLLKIQAEIFVGSVWTELEHVKFTGR